MTIVGSSTTHISEADLDDGMQGPLVRVGVGTNVKKYLLRLGIRAKGRCHCEDMAAMMDASGPAWCRENLDAILDSMSESAKILGVPFVRVAAKALVWRAIRKEEKRIEIAKTTGER